jgi:hypothetical protein
MERWRQEVDEAEARRAITKALRREREGRWDRSERAHAIAVLVILSIASAVFWWVWGYPWLWSKIGWIY